MNIPDASKYRERLERENAQNLTHLREVQGRIAHHEREIADLKEIEKQLLVIAKIVKPEEFGPKPKVKPRQNGKLSMSEETLQEAIVFLRVNYPDEDIFTARVLENGSWTLSKSHTQKILNELHERELLRLDSVGQGGRRNYRVVA